MKLRITAVLSILISVLLLFGGLSVSAAIAPGTKGSEVTAMQKKLIALGYLKDSADGSYGPATKAAVKSFESANGLTADGKADDTMLSLLSNKYNSAPRITVTASSLNVRKGAGTSYAKLGAVKKGKTYVVISQKTVSGTKWYSFMFGTRVGWVSGQYVSYKSGASSAVTTTAKPTTKSTTAASSAVMKGTVTASALNARSGAGTSYAVVTTLRKGSVITITGSKTVSGTKWYSFKSGSRTLWVSGQYLTIKTTATAASSTTAASTTKSTTAPSSVNKTYKHGTVKVNSSLNVRNGAGTGYAKLGSLAADELVVIDGKATTNGWYKVLYGDKFGWVSSKYIELCDESKMKTDHPEGADASALADEILSDMTTEEKVGQLLLPCTKNISEEELCTLISECNIGGVVLFKKDFENKTPQQVKDMIQAYQDAGNGKLFICVDEEGGSVVRLSGISALRHARYLSPQELYSLGGYELIEADTVNKTAFLRSFGINVNFGPVADVTTDENGFMYKRAFGRDADSTGKYVSAVVSAMNDSGVGSCIKHFPGYGNSTADTHIGLDRNKKTRDELFASDLVPFIDGIDSGADSIMMTHTVIESIDSERPASLSVSCTDLVRNELGFDGVIVTDGLDMGAVTEFCSDSDPCVESILGGCDLLCTPCDPAASYENLLNAVRCGIISEERLDASVKRILIWKIELGLYN